MCEKSTMTTALSRKHNKYNKNNGNNSQEEDEAEKPIKNSYAFALIFPPASQWLIIILSQKKLNRCTASAACLLINFYAFLQMFDSKKFCDPDLAFLLACSEASQSMAKRNFRFDWISLLAHRRPQKIAQKSLVDPPPTWLTLIGPIKRCSLISWHQLSSGSAAALALQFRPLLCSSRPCPADRCTGMGTINTHITYGKSNWARLRICCPNDIPICATKSFEQD